MNNKLRLIVPGIVLTGMLAYFLSPGTQKDKPDIVPERSAAPVSGDPVVTADPPAREEHLLTPEYVDSTALLPQQQAPELEREIREALGHILNTSSEGLVEETRNGVTSVNLQGRFQTAPVATIDADGKVQITDYSHLPRAATPP